MGKIVYYMGLVLQSVVFANYCTEEMFPEISTCTTPILPAEVDLNTAYTIKVPITIPAFFVSPAGAMGYDDCLTQCPADRASSVLASIKSAAENDEVD